MFRCCHGTESSANIWAYVVRRKVNGKWTNFYVDWMPGSNFLHDWIMMVIIIANLVHVNPPPEKIKKKNKRSEEEQRKVKKN